MTSSCSNRSSPRYPAVDLLVQQRLAQALAPQQRPLALPASLSEVRQGCGGLGGILMARLVQDAGGAIAAEAALARPHAQPQIAPQIVQHPGATMSACARAACSKSERVTSSHSQISESGCLAVSTLFQAMPQPVRSWASISGTRASGRT